MGIADIVDGTSNTLMVIEGGSAVPWTKPEDLPFTPPNFGAANVQIQIPPLGGAFKDVIHAAFADGHVATLKKNFDKQIMSAAITRNGGEVVDLDQLMDPAPGAEPEQLKLENEELRQQVELAKEQVDRLKEQLELTKKLAELKQQNIVADRLKRERQQLMKQLEQLRDEAERLRREIDRLGEVQKPTPTRKR
jgi:prepilin-type processing-associated H-X9-DG protein